VVSNGLDVLRAFRNQSRQQLNEQFIGQPLAQENTRALFSICPTIRRTVRIPAGGRKGRIFGWRIGDKMGQLVWPWLAVLIKWIL
jgi:hypothetical protein